MVRLRRRRVWRAAWLAAVVSILLAWQWMSRPVIVGRDPQQIVRVAKVIDGETLQISSGERFRLLGTNVPESAAPAAAEFLRSCVEGRDVSFGYDREATDESGRRFAYVYLQGRLINEDMIRTGLSRADLQAAYHESMKQRFRLAEREAREQRRGIWSEDRQPASISSSDAEELQDK